jgi:ribosomal RNA-processing protein 7
MPKVKSNVQAKAATIQGSAGAAPSTQYSGFRPVPVHITLSTDPATKAAKGKAPAAHYLWIREHKTRGDQASAGPSTGKVDPVLVKPTLQTSSAEQGRGEPSSAPGRTLFVANLAVDMDAEGIRSVFKEYGPVENISIKVSRVGNEGVEAWMDSDEEDEDEDGDDEELENQAEDGSMDAESGIEVETLANAFRPARPATATGTESNKKRRRKHKSGPSAPSIVPLPSLFPRSQPFLPCSSSAYVTYLSPLSLQRALEHAPTRPAITLVHSAKETGLAYYTQLHKATRPDISAVKSHADSALALYDHHLEVQRRKTTQGAIVDEDGFTLVVRGGKFGRTAGKGASGVGVASRRFVLDSKKVQAGGEATVDAREGLQRGKKRKGGVELDGFYRFQRNEKKRQGAYSARLASIEDHYGLANPNILPPSYTSISLDLYFSLSPSLCVTVISLV